MSPWAGTKRAPPARWLVRACACTEGQIHRLKLVKRQGYGRAGFALLRSRVLQAAWAGV
jgi:hypothetical protein